MLPAAARMRRRSDFTDVRRTGARARIDGISVAVLPALPDAPTGLPVVGFTVPRAAGTAVERNRVRRRLRHLVRPRLEDWPAGSRISIGVSAEATRSSSAELAVSLDRALARAVGRLPASDTSSGPRS